MNIEGFASKFVTFWGKTVLYVISGIIVIVICFVAFLYATTWWWPEIHGSHSLGNNIYMIDWDGGGKLVVRGTTVEGNTCYGGVPLIPTYENQYDSDGNWAEYVVDAVSDDNWIIVKTNNRSSDEKCYYIIDKREIDDQMSAEEIIETKIESFTDSTQFSQRCFENAIEMNGI